MIELKLTRNFYNTIQYNSYSCRDSRPIYSPSFRLMEQRSSITGRKPKFYTIMVAHSHILFLSFPSSCRLPIPKNPMYTVNTSIVTIFPSFFVRSFFFSTFLFDKNKTNDRIECIHFALQRAHYDLHRSRPHLLFSFQRLQHDHACRIRFHFIFFDPYFV